MKKTRPADIYLRFLRLAEALRGLPSLPDLDPLEERILALVARAQQDQQRLSVRDMLSKSELGPRQPYIHGLSPCEKRGG